MDGSQSAGNDDEMWEEILETDEEINPKEDTPGRSGTDGSRIDEKELFCSFFRYTHGSTVQGHSDPPTTVASSLKREIILGELEEELEKQLDEKAIRNELSATNVKSLLKAVLTHEDVLKYVEFALDQTEEPPEYQLKLTRAKAKELIDKLPDIAPLLCLPSTPVKSDINLLLEGSIAEEAEDDDDDDDYVPPEDVEDDDDDESVFTIGDDSSVTSLMSPPLDLTAVSSPGPVYEGVGKRTRSKFSLATTPLEAIEGEFVPPDVTEDLYNPVRGNREWLDFLKGLIQPLDPQRDRTESGSCENGHIDDNDDENDPEYNVMSDEELEVPDVEELRNDRTVKISRKEISSLMSELAEYTQMLEEGYHSEEENCEAEEDNGDLMNAQSFTQDKDETRATFTEEHIIPSDDDGIAELENLLSHDQYLLIQQQISQHTQLLLQTYLLCLGNPFVDASTRERSKAFLIQIKALGDESSLQIANTFSIVESYERYVSENEQALWQWHHEALHSGKKHTNIPVHPRLMEFCLSSGAFPYPLLLPEAGFKPVGFYKKTPFFESVDMLISSALDDCVTNLKLSINTHNGLRTACDIIRAALLPDRSTDSIMKHVQSKKKSLRPNPIKNYFLGLGPPAVEHFVTPVSLELLCHKDARLIDNSWHMVLYAVRNHIQKSGSSRG